MMRTPDTSFSPLRVTTRIIRVMTAAFVLLVAMAYAAAMAQANTNTKTRVIPLAQEVLYGRDIFPNATAIAERVIAPAPAPGGSVTFDARTLMGIAKAMAVGWTPSSMRETVTITREANLLPETAISKAIIDGLRDQGVLDNVRIALDPIRDLSLPAHALAPDLRVDAIRMGDDRRMTGVLIAAHEGVEVARADFSAQIVPLITLPVLRTPKERGNIITASDLDWQTRDAHTLLPDALIDADSIIGTQAKRTLMPDQPIRTGDLALPTLIKRGEPITLVLRDGGMTLTVKGRAIEQGARGDVIRVVNVASNKTMHGMITGDAEVSIQ